MSNEELERIMNFIIERQEYAAAQLDRLIETQDRLTGAQARSAEQMDDHDERIARFERSYVAISRLLERNDDQLVALTDGLNNLTDMVARLAARAGDHDERIARLEQSNAVIVRLLEKHDGQLEKHDDQLMTLTDGLNKLTTLVDRYIAARGNGGNGGGA